jgi:pheromone shutdown protein TraB
MTAVFDTLHLTDEFKAAGFSENEARALAEKFRAMTSEHLVTKEYLDYKLSNLEYRLINKIVLTNIGTVIASVTILRLLLGADG